MELKPTIQHYTESEFLSLVQTIFDVNVRKEDHDKLINHFDSIAGHPAGADIIFHSRKINRNMALLTPSSVVGFVKNWHIRKGTPYFKEEAGATPAHAVKNAGPTFSPSDPRYKTQQSQKKLDKVLQLEDKVNIAKNTVELALVEQERALREAAIHLSPQQGESASTHLLVLTSAAEQIDVLHYRTNVAIGKFKYLETEINFTRDDAKIWLSNPYFDRPLQEVAVQKALALSNLYTTALADINPRHNDIHLRTEALLDRALEQLIRLNSSLGTGPAVTAGVFKDSLTASQVSPSLLISASRTKAPFKQDRMRLLKSLRSAIAEFTWMSDAGNEQRTGKYADVLLFSSTSREGERFAVSVPLNELMPIDGRDWQSLANTDQKLEVPFRIGTGVTTQGIGRSYVGLKELTEFSRIYVTPTQGTSLPSSIRVKAAVWDAEQNAYRFTTQGIAPTTVLWTVEDALTAHANRTSANTEPLPNRLNTVQSALDPVIETFSSGEDVHFDDYIVTFPADSGLAPLYLTLKDRREYPGVASGNGQIIEDAWFSGELSEAAIPSQIAAVLRGQSFKNLSAFRDAFWMAVAANPSLTEAFNSEDLALMATDRPPRSPRIVTTGQQRNAEIRHVSAIEYDGGVYDMDNMRIVIRL